MNTARTITSVPAVRRRETSTGVNVARELLIAGALFAALVVIGTAFFFAVAPSIADIASLYVSTT